MNHFHVARLQRCGDNLDPDALAIVAKEDCPRELGVGARRVLAEIDVAMLDDEPGAVT
jgi:hypothetical protein